MMYRMDISADGRQGWAVWKIEETDTELYSQLPVDGCYAREIDAFCASPKRRLERLAVRVLMFQCWKKEYPVGYQNSGKPYVFDAPFYISISHTQGYAALVWSDQHPVSIDIEQIRPKALLLKKRFVGLDEHGAGNPLHEALLHWSAKETLYKILPHQEGTDFVHHLYIFPFTIYPCGYVWGCDKRVSSLFYQLAYHIEQDYVMTFIC